MGRTAAVCLMLASLLAGGDGQESKKAASTFMQLKLKNAQLILEGLATNDFDQVATSSEYLFLLSRKAEFQHLDTPEYRRFSNDFQRSARKLAQFARQKNLDGATLAYVQLTMSCVNCHKHLRSVE